MRFAGLVPVEIAEITKRHRYFGCLEVESMESALAP
jgi:hypothetical protein